jgi:hypothetical protein
VQAAQEFMTFLVDQTEHKLGEIKKATQGESTKFAVDEVTVFVKKMREVIPLVCDSNEQSPSDPPSPTPPSPASRRRGSNA